MLREKLLFGLVSLMAVSTFSLMPKSTQPPITSQIPVAAELSGGADVYHMIEEVLASYEVLGRVARTDDMIIGPDGRPTEDAARMKLATVEMAIGRFTTRCQQVDQWVVRQRPDLKEGTVLISYPCPNHGNHLCYWELANPVPRELPVSFLDQGDGI